VLAMTKSREPDESVPDLIKDPKIWRCPASKMSKGNGKTTLNS
jgi:hypothetical protein